MDPSLSVDWCLVTSTWECAKTISIALDSFHVTNNYVINCSDLVALSPRPCPKVLKGLATLARIFICAKSAVFVWSREVMFVHYKLLHSWHTKVVDSFQDLLKMGTKRISINLEFRNFGVFTLARLLLPQRICLYSFHSKICSSTHSIVNSSWLAHDHTVLLHHMLTQHIWKSLKCKQAPFLIFWEGPGDEAIDLYKHDMVPSSVFVTLQQSSRYQ